MPSFLPRRLGALRSPFPWIALSASLALTGRDGGAMAKLLRANDHHLNVAHMRTMRVQEIHLLVIHCLCEVVDNVIYGEKK